MQADNDTKAINLRPSPRQYLPRYLLGLLTIPLFGLGIYLIYRARRKQQHTRYRITDRSITSADFRYHHTIDLKNIREVTVRSSIAQKLLGIGSVVLRTDEREMVLEGMRDYLTLKDTIEKAVTALRNRPKGMDDREVREPELEPGTMERMNYLTGLWQQGLLSDGDFREERKNFE